MFEYFYNEIFRSIIIGFGSLFNGIEVQHKDSGDDVAGVIKVPLGYGPTQKFLARLQQESDLNNPIQMTLPRMSFEFKGLQYDPSRKSTQTQTFISQSADGTKLKKGYLPVPYNMSFELSIMTKMNDDMLQIIEQILPYFQPAYNLSIKFLGELKEKRDISIQLDSISMEDDYEGNFDTRRALVYTLQFTAKTYLFGPISDVTGDIIKKVSVGYVAGSKSKTLAPSRDITYSVTPRAVKDYNGSTVTTLAKNVDMVETSVDVVDGSTLTKKTYIYVGTEEMYIESIDGNTITVRRGEDSTTQQNHVSGSDVKTITQEDNDLIEFGDNFGFDGNVF